MMEDVATITLNSKVVFLANMMIQMVENVEHNVSLIVLGEAFARNYLRVLFAIVIIDNMLCH